jgi:hypothetical protein
MPVSAATRPGRGHRRADQPCQDAFAVREVPERELVIFAVADGLGSQPLSHIGSEVATRAAVERLAREGQWDVRTMLRAFRSARRALRTEAATRGVHLRELATTLQVGVLGPHGATAAMVGDGAMVAGRSGGQVLLAPEPGGYANEVAPLTATLWRMHFHYAHQDGARWMLGFTDGLTRLLLARSDGAWTPYRPFWDAFVPRLESYPFEPGLAERFLAGDHVDSFWDDDKCLVAAVRHAGV